MVHTGKIVPVIVISGFLGSGKTTLLKKWIDKWTASGARPAVVMNELGEINLDGEIIGGGVPMSELLGGCICCTISGDFGMELARMVEEEEPDVLFVETTGAANPMELIDGITEASLYVKLALVQVVIIVDGRHLLDLHEKGKGKTYRLMEEQIRCADVLLVNKSDLLNDGELAEVDRLVMEWNAKAALAHTVNCETNGELPALWDEQWNQERVGIEKQANRVMHGHEHEAHEHDNHEHHEHEHHAHHSHEHVMVYTHYFARPVDSEKFERFIELLPPSVYRAKGILSFTDTSSRYLFQFAYRQADYMAITPQKEVPDVLVLIGEHMPTSDIKAALDQLDTE
jgi:G3E family GTPase